MVENGCDMTCYLEVQNLLEKWFHVVCIWLDDNEKYPKVRNCKGEIKMSLLKVAEK